MRKYLPLMLLAALGFAGTAQAEGAFRVGIGAGQINFEYDDDAIDVKADATAFEFYGGYEFNPYLAVELGYLDGGAAKDEIEGVVFETKTTAIIASVLGSWPLGEHFSVYGRAGFMQWEGEEAARIDGSTIVAGEADGSDPIFGIGAAAHIDGALVRLEYRMAEIDLLDMSLISLGIVWRF